MRTKGRPCFRHTAPWGPFTMYTKLMLPSPTSWTCTLCMAAQQSVPQQLAGRSNPVFPFLGTHLNHLSLAILDWWWDCCVVACYILTSELQNSCMAAVSEADFCCDTFAYNQKAIGVVLRVHASPGTPLFPPPPPPLPPTNHYVLSARALATDWFCRTHASSMHVFYVQNLAAYNERPSRVPCRPAIGTKGTTGRR